MSKKSEAAWIEAYRKADHIYTQMDCGCLALVLVDMPDVVKDSRDEIAAQALMGRTLKRCRKGDLPPLNCESHQRQREASHA